MSQMMPRQQCLYRTGDVNVGMAYRSDACTEQVMHCECYVPWRCPHPTDLMVILAVTPVWYDDRYVDLHSG